MNLAGRRKHGEFLSAMQTVTEYNIGGRDK